MVRLSHDREAQMQVAQVLVKSTTAICTAIGAQPIPLADLPVLTTLQLVMVSGIMTSADVSEACEPPQNLSPRSARMSAPA